MKEKFLYIILILAIVALNGCQDEKIEIDEPPTEQAFKASAPIAIMAMRIALRDGSKDNIISGSSCISFALPITVVVNGQQLNIASEEDYNKVEKILDQYDGDNDSVQVVFPVTVILPDYSEVIINNEDELEDYIEGCIEGGEDDDIECVDFKYPLTISLYDAQNQISNVITINNDSELLDFLEDLEDDVYASFEFPVTLVLSDGTEVQAQNNKELEDIINNAKDDCDEDDDQDFDDDDADTSGFNMLLTTSDWKITYFFDVGDQTEIFNGWIFHFNNDNTIEATDGKSSLIGSWESYGDSGKIELEIEFDSRDPVKELIEEWKVVSYNQQTIKLEDTSGGDPLIVIFEKL